jgi:hypothetical protein
MTPGLAWRVALVILTGLAWAIGSVVGMTDPATTDPNAPLDWFAIYSLSVALFLSAAGLLVLHEAARSGEIAGVAILIMAAAYLLAAITNTLANGLGLPGFGIAFVVSVLIAWIGSFILAGLMAISGERTLSLVPLLSALGFGFYAAGGGLLMLAGWLLFAAVLVRRPRATAEVA